MLNIRKAVSDDFDAVYEFYRIVCEAAEREEYGPVWHIGIYPSASDLREHIENGELWIGEREGEILSAMVVTDREDTIYEQVPWKLRFSPEHVSVLHLFAVKTQARGQGISRKMLERMFDFCRKQGKTVIHLDVVAGNLPAEMLYQHVGFSFTCEMNVFYEDTGELRVRLYEYKLD